MNSNITAICMQIFTTKITKDTETNHKFFVIFVFFVVDSCQRPGYLIHFLKMLAIQGVTSTVSSNR